MAGKLPQICSSGVLPTSVQPQLARTPRSYAHNFKHGQGWVGRCRDSKAEWFCRETSDPELENRIPYKIIEHCMRKEFPSA